ncbi:MAG: hypothetical protein ABI369_07250 [Acetobacteraceae bacterium]
MGRLQGLGLAVDDLGQLPPDRSEQAGQDATLKALNTLRQQVADAAAALGLEVNRI